MSRNINNDVDGREEAADRSDQTRSKEHTVVDTTSYSRITGPSIADLHVISSSSRSASARRRRFLTGAGAGMRSSWTSSRGKCLCASAKGVAEALVCRCLEPRQISQGCTMLNVQSKTHDTQRYIENIENRTGLTSSSTSTCHSH